VDIEDYGNVIKKAAKRKSLRPLPTKTSELQHLYCHKPLKKSRIIYDTIALSVNVRGRTIVSSLPPSAVSSILVSGRRINLEKQLAITKSTEITKK
jgi:hypothetical protein